MIALLKKLRIDFSSLVMLDGFTDLPKEGTTKFHSKILAGFLEGQNNQCFVSDEEREKMRDKTNRQLRLREMLKQHSKNANLIVMSLPMPRVVSLFFNLSKITLANNWFLARNRREKCQRHSTCHGWRRCQPAYRPCCSCVEIKPTFSPSTREGLDRLEI
jgi:hypothetical protein